MGCCSERKALLARSGTRKDGSSTFDGSEEWVIQYTGLLLGNSLVYKLPGWHQMCYSGAGNSSMPEEGSLICARIARIAAL